MTLRARSMAIAGTLATLGAASAAGDPQGEPLFTFCEEEDNDRCERAQEIDAQTAVAETDFFKARDGFFLTGKLQKDEVWDCEPKSALIAYGKPTQCFDEAGRAIPNRFAEPILATSLSGQLSDLAPLADGTVRLGLAATSDANDGTINGLASNDAHQEFGEVTLKVFFNDAGGPRGEELAPDETYVFDFQNGSDALRVAFQVPSSVSTVDVIACEDTGTVEVAWDTDFYNITNLKPNRPYCLTVVGGLTDMSPFPAALAAVGEGFADNDNNFGENKWFAQFRHVKSDAAEKEIKLGIDPGQVGTFEQRDFDWGPSGTVHKFDLCYDAQSGVARWTIGGTSVAFDVPEPFDALWITAKGRNDDGGALLKISDVTLTGKSILDFPEEIRAFRRADGSGVPLRYVGIVGEQPLRDFSWSLRGSVSAVWTIEPPERDFTALEIKATDSSFPEFEFPDFKTPAILGLFDKSCQLLQVSQPSVSGAEELCVLSDDMGRIRFGVSGYRDRDFDGFLDGTKALRDFLSLYLFFNHDIDVEFVPGSSTKDNGSGAVRLPRSVWADEDLRDEIFCAALTCGNPLETLLQHCVSGEYCIKVRLADHVDSDDVPPPPEQPPLEEIADFDGSGGIDSADLATLLNYWGATVQ